jgi:hypothetical protein
MRIAEATLMSLAVAVAVPSGAGAQVLTPFLGNPWPLYDERLDHPVPVATVSRVDDLVSLSHPRTVQDGLGEPFVLGDASLDLRDPAHAKVVFTMANATQAPLLLDDVVIHEVRLCSLPDRSHPFAYPQVGGRGDGFHGTAELQSGERVTAEIPVPPNCQGKGTDTVAILVRVGRPGPAEASSTPAIRASTALHVDNALFSRFFQYLRAHTTSPAARR